MFTRFALALIVVLTGLMVAISPVAGMAAGDRVACAQQVEVAPDHHHMGHETMTPMSDEGAQPGFICCDNGCLFDVSITDPAKPVATRMTRVLTHWAASDFSDLTDPGELRRPPRS